MGNVNIAESSAINVSTRTDDLNPITQTNCQQPLIITDLSQPIISTDSATTCPLKLCIPVTISSILPKLATPDSAAHDVYTAEAATVLPGRTLGIKLQLQLAIPQNYYGLLSGRSSLAIRGLYQHWGIIDSDFRGAVVAVVHNTSHQPFLINKGQKISQLLICPKTDVRYEKVSQLPVPEQSHTGFGSSSSHNEPSGFPPSSS